MKKRFEGLQVNLATLRTRQMRLGRALFLKIRKKSPSQKAKKKLDAQISRYSVQNASISAQIDNRREWFDGMKQRLS